MRCIVNLLRKYLLEFAVALLPKIPIRVLGMSGTFGDAPFGAVPFGGSWVDPLLSDVGGILERDDAEHVVHAVRAGCRYFLTLDKAIRSRVRVNSERIASLCGALEFMNPTELATRLCP